MKEDFLHQVWKLRKFRNFDFQTNDSEALEIIKPGEHNTNAGPDFFNARIKIGDTLWAGNVEIHIKSSDWQKHGHQNDPAYDNIILHAVYENDSEIKRKDGTSIPVLELKKYIDPEIWLKYDYLLKQPSGVACENAIQAVDGFTIANWMDRLIIERLENKTSEIDRILKNNNNNWEETLYQFLARSFGFKINAVPFELLARSLPLSIIGKHKNSLFQIEALLFGQAGLLNEDFRDNYPIELKKEYLFLKQKYSLNSLESHLWKHLRLRPINFPSVRIAQFAQLMYKSACLFSKILELKSIHEFENLFELSPSIYWENHYQFDSISPIQSKNFGRSAIKNIVINGMVPILFLYGIRNREEAFKDGAIRLLEKLAPEENTIITMWNNLGIQSRSAFETQALIQLKNEYCIPKKCLTCSIGNKLIYSK